MTLFPSREILKRRAEIGLIIAFFAVIWLPAADRFLHLDRSKTMNENRAFAPFPKFVATLDGTRTFLAGLEAYFNDHFGFRKQLVRWERRLRWNFFHESRGSTVLEGKSDWLFYSDGRMVDDISGTMPFTAEELEKWRKLLVARRDWLRERGIRYLFVVPPDKHSVYPEYLPDWLLSLQRPPHRLDQFFAHMREHSDVPVLDLRPALLEAKKHGEIYLHSDTHWNDRGAFAAYRRIMQELNTLGVLGTAVALDSFDETVHDQPGGDLVRLLGREGLIIEKNTPTLSPKPGPAKVTWRTNPEVLPKKWAKYTEPVVSENPDARGKIVMFRDSFAGSWPKFFGINFGRVVYVWQQNWDRDFIEREKPDVVIDSILERFTIFRDAESLLKADEDPEFQALLDR